MLQFSNYKSYKDNFKKNKISLVYSTEHKSKPSKIETLIENILTKKNSFIFESVEKLFIVDVIPFLDMTQIKYTKLKTTHCS